MILEIVSVGTELLMGQVTNTNAQFIAEHTAPLGYACLYQITVGDNPARLTEVVKTALSRSDVVVFTGGLGPTTDDLTKETVAAALGMTCEPNETEIERLTRYFTEKGREMTPNNLKQAWFPKEAIILPNPKGTAPGCILERDGKAAILMPGPPREMQPMFLNSVIPYLEQRSGETLFSRELRVFGIGESKLTHMLADVIENQTNPTIAPYAKTGECTLRLTARAKDAAEGEKLLQPLLEIVRACAGDRLYSENGEPLNVVCANLLKESGKKLAVAESCTGGLLTSAFVDLPGSSEYLIEGAVTYCEDAKMRRLGVTPETLETDGVVSARCAEEMALGMLLTSGADIALATTGIAGPGGGTEEKPVGLVYIGFADKDGACSLELRLSGDRARIRETAVLHALDFLRRKCLNLGMMHGTL